MMKYIEILSEAKGLPFDEWKAYLRRFNLTKDVVELIDGVPNGTHFHPEFCTLRHTYDVCRAVCEASDYLLEAAFLHDVGKSTHTNIGRDRIYGFGHAQASARYVLENRARITNLDLTYRIVEHHMDFNDYEAEKLKFDIPLKFFTYCDKKRSRELYLAEASPVELALNKAREKWLYLKQQYFARKEVIILVGISGSGKSRYISENYDPRYVVCPDDIRTELGDINNMKNQNEVWEITRIEMREALAKYGKVVLDATNVNKWLRVQFMAQFNGCRKVAVVFNTDVDVAIERVQNDIKNGVHRSNVPKKSIKGQAHMFNKGKKSLYHEFNEVIEL